MNEKPKTRRRWLQFSLRTLLVMVTVLCLWLGWQVNNVRERKAVFQECEAISPNGVVDYHSLEYLEVQSYEPIHSPRAKYIRVSKIRRLMGDESYVEIHVPRSLSASWLDRLEHAFPEAILFGISDTEYPFRDSQLLPIEQQRPNEGTLFRTGLIEK